MAMDTNRFLLGVCASVFVLYALYICMASQGIMETMVKASPRSLVGMARERPDSYEYDIMLQSRGLKRFSKSVSCEMDDLDEVKSRDARWRVVAENQSYVYSAHMDVRSKTSLVKVFGAFRADVAGTNATDFHCQLWVHRKLVTSVPGKLLLRNKRNWEFLAGDIHCKFDFPPDELPRDYSVAVVKSKCRQPKQLLSVNNPIHKFNRGFNREFTVCVMADGIRLNNPLRFLEWIEANRVLGAEKIILYNNNITCPQIRQIIRSYEERDIIQVLPWNIPDGIRGNRHLHKNLRTAMIADCQFREMFDSHYIVNVDVDEFILPRSDSAFTWSDLITKSNCKDAVVYQLSSLTFDSTIKTDDCRRLDLCTDCRCLEASRCHKDNTMLVPCHTTRYAENLPQNSKYIGRPLLIDRMRMHSAIPKYRSCDVDVSYGAVHRFTDYDMKYVKHNVSRRIVTDIRVKTFGEHLAGKVVENCKNL